MVWLPTPENGWGNKRQRSEMVLVSKGVTWPTAQNLRHGIASCRFAFCDDTLSPCFYIQGTNCRASNSVNFRGRYLNSPNGAKMALGNTRVRRCFRFRWERIWVDSTCLRMGGKVRLTLWVKLGCSPRSTQMVPKWRNFPPIFKQADSTQIRSRRKTGTFLHVVRHVRVEKISSGKILATPARRVMRKKIGYLGLSRGTLTSRNLLLCKPGMCRVMGVCEAVPPPPRVQEPPCARTNPWFRGRILASLFLPG